MFDLHTNCESDARIIKRCRWLQGASTYAVLDLKLDWPCIESR